jgi:cell fate regulator YaaT (PSP1 superfamily)
MPTVVGVILRNASSPVFIDPADVEIAEGDVLVIESDRGTELARVAEPPHEREPHDVVDASSKVTRVATSDDLATAAELHAREKAAMPVYRRLVAKHGLEMKPTDVEFLFDGQRAVFYFVAEDRVDFRELVRDLAAEFHLRIDMRQIGVRDEARMIGGLGHCGEQLCCVRFGGEFQPVSIRMAKEQDLPLNPLKISGLCGRLMCCLRYEYDAYKDFKGRAPKKGAVIDIGGTLGKVVELDTPRERITMRKEDGTRVTVALSDMECSKGEGCPCAVKAEALERSMAALLEATPSGVHTRTRTLSESSTREAVVAPSSTERTAEVPASDAAPGAPARRKRRRRGGSGGGGGGEAGAGGGAKATTQSSQPKRQQPQGGQSKAGAPRQAPTAPAGGEGAFSAPKHRRRRRRGGGSGGESAAPASGE